MKTTPTTTPPITEEAIIVLGAAQYNGRPSGILRRRLESAVALPLPLRLPIVTVGGNLPGDVHTEAGVARDYLHQHAPLRQVLAVEEGLDTESSLQAVADALSYRKVVIVTDPLHCLRAGLIARRVGFDARTVGVDGHAPRPLSKAWFRYLSHECGGLFVFAVRDLLGDCAADFLSRQLHRVEVLVRPNQRQRHENLRKRDL